jgi:HAD superfamily hydrolase (TIGR01509 family)
MQKRFFMSQISCVLFDLGGVMINWNDSWLIQEISKEFRLPEEQVTKEWRKNLPDISIGKVDEKKFWRTIGETLESEKLANYKESLLDRMFRKRVSLNESVISLSKQLSQNMPVGILSNTELVTFSVIEDLISLDHFKHKFLSYEIGHIKPDVEIYNHVIENIPFLKEEVFFIDDLKPNVESARNAGIDAVQYSDYDTLVQECKIRKLL